MRNIVQLFVVGFVSLWVVGAPGAEDSKVKDTIAARFAEVVPDLRVNDVRPAPIPGWYEVLLGAKLVYVTEDARYVFDGTLMDLKEQKNLSSKPAMEARATALKAMSDGQKVIEFAPAGVTEYVVYVFTDTDCTYCRKLHSEVPKLNGAGIAVRYLAFPRAGIGSRTYQQMVSVWCAADPKQALTDAKAGKDLPAAACDNPVKEEWELGNSMNVHGTPTTLLDSGEEVGGYIPAEELIKF